MKSILIGGLTPGAMLALTSIAVFYSIWMALLVAVGSFAAVNLLIICLERRQWLKAMVERWVNKGVLE